MGLRDWLVDTVTVEVAPARATKYILLTLASPAGGWAFAATGSWITAVQWYFFAFLGVWALSKAAEGLAALLVKAILWFWPPFSVQ